MKYDTIYLFCQHRSGSTFVSNLLYSEYDIQRLPEELNIIENRIYGTTIWELISRKGITVMDLKKCHGSFWNYLKNYIDDDENFCEKINALRPIHPDDVVQLVCREIGLDPNKPVLVKYPYDILSLRSYNLQLLNETNFILLRDLYDNIESKINDEEMRKRRKKSYFSYWIKRILISLLYAYRQKNLYRVSKLEGIQVLKYEEVVFEGATGVKNMPANKRINFDRSVEGKASSKLPGFRKLSGFEKFFVRLISNA